MDVKKKKRKKENTQASAQTTENRCLAQSPLLFSITAAACVCTAGLPVAAPHLRGAQCLWLKAKVPRGVLHRWEGERSPWG